MLYKRCCCCCCRNWVISSHDKHAQLPADRGLSSSQAHNVAHTTLSPGAKHEETLLYAISSFPAAMSTLPVKPPPGAAAHVISAPVDDPASRDCTCAPCLERYAYRVARPARLPLGADAKDRDAGCSWRLGASTLAGMTATEGRALPVCSSRRGCPEANALACAASFSCCSKAGRAQDQDESPAKMQPCKTRTQVATRQVSMLHVWGHSRCCRQGYFSPHQGQLTDYCNLI